MPVSGVAGGGRAPWFRALPEPAMQIPAPPLRPTHSQDERHERSSLFAAAADRAAVRIRDPADPRLAQDPRRRLAPGHPRGDARDHAVTDRSEEHTSELQSLMRNSYAVFC